MGRMIMKTTAMASAKRSNMRVQGWEMPPERIVVQRVNGRNPSKPDRGFGGTFGSMSGARRSAHAVSRFWGSPANTSGMPRSIPKQVGGKGTSSTEHALNYANVPTRNWTMQAAEQQKE
ncbi:uncharacterized protein VDAG_09191 [Verticillium dahliae VdLs.17]|uniref:Uncharacterized protein n=2 Tax=Verticillium dahliae TaxID=27337 RepID=G2XFR7_VERDV|nr:uncharacterized protein VDAG_09191 [Verticillium dahliae VdLs.17]EGY18665.1 hypothetical protein VDAG_09191 [Verticillium dahliae VdLs.17]KAH6705873.1 hypothetical protein EV126DRAFT_439931 [Verticillium dahliae]